MIRDVTEGDAAPIVAIYNHYIRNSTATFEEEEISRDDLVRRMQQVKAMGFPWIVAEDQGKIVGYAYATQWRDRSAYRFAAEVTVYVANESTSGGWGTQLYESLFSKLEKMKIHVVIGGITLPNDASVALHEKFGMTKAAHFEEVGKKFGKWLDVGYWQKMLDA